MGSPGVDESATGQSCSHGSSSQPPSPWPGPPPSQMTPRHPALTPMLPLTRGMATTAMVDTEVTMVATTDLTDTATTARDLLMRLPPLSLAPTPMLMPMPGMATMVMDTEVTTVATWDLMLMAYGKRSADEAAPAESGPNAEANADPWYSYYGGYGYGAYRPYGYGYYGYRPYGYAYWG